MDRQAWRQWWRAATKPRLLGILVILVIGAVVCIQLGAWQLDRAQIRGDQAAQLEQDEREAAAPVPLTEVVPPQTQLTQEMVGVRVLAEGIYHPDDQLFVVGRQAQAQPGDQDQAGAGDPGAEDPMGYWVLTALELSGEDHAGAIVPVVRGWVPEADPALVPEVPEGPVEVLAYLAPSESGGPRLPEPDLVDVVSSAQLVNEWGGPIYSAYLRVISQDPAAAPEIAAVGPPEIEDAGLNIQNLAYAAEWWIFGGFAMFLWWRLVRDEVKHDREVAAESRASEGVGDDGSADGARASEGAGDDGSASGAELGSGAVAQFGQGAGAEGDVAEVGGAGGAGRRLGHHPYGDRAGGLQPEQPHEVPRAPVR